MSVLDGSAHVCGVIQAASVDASVLGIAPIVITMETASAISEQVVTSQTSDYEQPAAQLVDAETLVHAQNIAPEPITEETIAPEEIGIARAPECLTTVTQRSAHPGSGHPGPSVATAGRTHDDATSTTPVSKSTGSSGKAINRPHECKICGKRLTAKKHLVTHMRRIHDKLKPYECPVCKRCFAANGDLTRHKSTVHVVDRLFQCLTCNKAFKTDELLRKHSREVHTDDRQHRCEDCKKAYKTDRSLRKHLGIVHGQPTFSFHQCPDCGVRVSGQRALDEHKSTVHDKLVPHQCEDCGRKFKRKSQVNRHKLSVHAKDKPHKCAKCDKAFAVKTYLTRHVMSVHWNGDVEGSRGGGGGGGGGEGGEGMEEGEENEVGAQFVEGQENQENQEEGSSAVPSSGESSTPTQRHPFASHPCEDCNKVLKSKELLRQHQAVVHGKGKFHQCNDCGIRVRGQSALQEHQMAVHGKQKPNECPDCGKFFTRKRDVKRHQMIVHLKKKPHQCDTCGKMFSRKADLIKHERLHGTDSAADATADAADESSEDAAKKSGPVAEEVTRSMESLVDLLVLASEINAGIGAVSVPMTEGLLQLQNAVPGHQEEVTLESGVQPSAGEHQTSAANATDEVHNEDQQPDPMDTREGTQDGSTTSKPDGDGTDEPDKMDTTNDQLVNDDRPKTRPLLQCPECRKTFKAKAALVEHLAIKHGKGKFEQCIECDHRFIDQTALQEHQKSVHDKEKENKCEECGKMFSRSRDLKRHVTATHNRRRARKSGIDDNSGKTNDAEDAETTGDVQKDSGDLVTSQQTTPQGLTRTESVDSMDTIEGSDEDVTTQQEEDQMDTADANQKQDDNTLGPPFVFRSTPTDKASRKSMGSDILKKVRRAPLKERDTSPSRSKKATRLENIALSLAQNQKDANTEQ